MSWIRSIRWCVLTAGAVTLSAPVVLSAQVHNRLQVAVAAGPTYNDLEALSTIWAVAAGLEWRPMSRLLVIDSSARYAAYTPSATERYLLPEMSWQLEAILGAFRPFAGVGAGLAFLIRPGESATSASYHIAGGARVALGERFGVRAEARLRSVEPVGDFTFGMTYGLGER